MPPNVKHERGAVPPSPATNGDSHAQASPQQLRQVGNAFARSQALLATPNANMRDRFRMETPTAVGELDMADEYFEPPASLSTRQEYHSEAGEAATYVSLTPRPAPSLTQRSTATARRPLSVGSSAEERSTAGHQRTHRGGFGGYNGHGHSGQGDRDHEMTDSSATASGPGVTESVGDGAESVLLRETRHIKRPPVDPDMSSLPVSNGFGGGVSSRPSGSFVGQGFTAIGDKVRELNDTLAELQALGIQHVTNLPELVLVGDQSAGKSSLMSSFSGIYLPRSDGACTRCPVHIRLSASPVGEPWKCKVSLQEDYAYDATHRNVTKTHPFGPWREKPTNQRVTKHFQTMADPAKIEQTLRWAQAATLNPNHEHSLYRPDTGDIWRRSQGTPPEHNQAAFSPNTVALEISAPELTDLSFYDLPGVFTSARRDEDQYLVQVVRNLVIKYISHTQAIILWAVPMNADPETSSTFSIIREQNAQSRTIGVMTKADLLSCDPGATLQWLAMLRGEQHGVRHGYFITARPLVKPNMLPDDGHSNSQLGAPSGGPDELEQQGAFEESFFNRTLSPLSTREPLLSHDASRVWPTSFAQFEHRCGVSRLVAYMSQQLGKEFANCLPQIREKVLVQLGKVEQELSSLPEMPDNPELAVRHGLSRFATLVRTSLAGPDLQPRLSAIVEGFQADILELKPKYLIQAKNNPVGLGPGQGRAPGTTQAVPSAMTPAVTPSRIHNVNYVPAAANATANAGCIDLTMDDESIVMLGRAPSPSVAGSVVGASGGPSRRRRTHNDFRDGHPDPRTPSKRPRGPVLASFHTVKDEPVDRADAFSPVFGANRTLFPRTDPLKSAPSRTLVQVREIIANKSQPGMPTVVAEGVYNFLSREAVAPWSGHVEQLVAAVFRLLAGQLERLLAEAMAGLRGRHIVDKSAALLDRFLKKHEEALLATLLKQCRLEGRRLYTLNTESLKQYREDELRLLTRHRHQSRMQAYLEASGRCEPGQGQAQMANGGPVQNGPTPGTQPAGGQPSGGVAIKDWMKDWSLMADEERAREKHRMGLELAKLGPDPYDEELKVCAYVRGYYRTASMRFVDTCALHIVSGLMAELEEELADEFYLDVELGLLLSGKPATASAAGSEAGADTTRRGPTEQTFLDLMVEDPETARRRAELKEERERYLRTISSIQRVGDHSLRYDADSQAQSQAQSVQTAPAFVFGNGRSHSLEDEDASI